MLLKCYTQYFSKFGKLSSSHKTGKGQFSFQSQRRAMPKNVQTRTTALISHASKISLKYFNPGLSSVWTKNFQLYKLDFKKAEEQEIKLPTFAGSQRKQTNSRKTCTSASLTMLKPLTVWITKNCGKFWKRWESLTTRPPYLPPEKSVCRSISNS